MITSALVHGLHYTVMIVLRIVSCAVDRYALTVTCVGVIYGYMMSSSVGTPSDFSQQTYGTEVTSLPGQYSKRQMFSAYSWRCRMFVDNSVDIVVTMHRYRFCHRQRSSYAHYTPPTPTRLNCRVGGVHWALRFAVGNRNTCRTLDRPTRRI